jgi:two-component system, NtrC family, sensor kinase
MKFKLNLEAFAKAGRLKAVTIVFVAGTLFTLGIFVWAWQKSLSEYREHFELDASIRGHMVKQYLDSQLQDLDALKRFIEGKKKLDRQAFVRFVKPILERKGVKAVEWIPAVPLERRASFENRAVSEGLENYRIFEHTPAGALVPAGKREFYYPVYYVEPVKGNEKAIGFDLGSNPARLAAINASIASGRPQVTGRITLVQESGKQFGFLVFVPVYSDESILEGFALGVYRAGEMMENAIRHSSEVGLNTSLCDFSGPPNERVLHEWTFDGRSTKRSTGMITSWLFPLLTRSMPMDFAGRKWSIIVSATDAFRAETSSGFPLAILLGGLSLTVFLSIYLNSVLSHRDDTEALVEERTAHLSELNQSLENYTVELEMMKGNLFDQNIQLEQEVAERQKAQEELQVKQLQLEKSNECLELRVAEEVEKSRLRDAALIQTEKLACIGQLAAGVAHEINNPVGFITSNLNTLKKYADAITTYIRLCDKEIRDGGYNELGQSIAECSKILKLKMILDDLPFLVDESLEGAERVKRIVMDMKNYARPDEQGLRKADLNQSIQSTVNIVRNEIKYVADLIIDLGEIPQIVCNPQHLNQVITNLLVNAAHAIAEFGKITVNTKQEEDFVVLSVSDTGCGIPPEIMSRIFDPFFTTKEIGKGTGLGLSIIHDIVKNHGGMIEVESEVGKGTTFTVRLPIQGPYIQEAKDGEGYLPLCA